MDKKEREKKVIFDFSRNVTKIIRYEVQKNEIINIDNILDFQELDSNNNVFSENMIDKTANINEEEFTKIVEKNNDDVTKNKHENNK